MIGPVLPTIALVPTEGNSTPAADARGLRIAIVVSRYNERVTGSMERGAVVEFVRLGGRAEDLVRVTAAGAFELPVLCRHAAESCDAVVALGCVIKGETRHDQVIGDSVANALAGLSVQTGTPVAFGVLTVDTIEQALARAQPVDETNLAFVGADDRAGEKGKPVVDNKGVEAMRAAVETVNTIRAMSTATRI
jgi:6,7-dimethyl-8-ribityllumazine synthase